MNGYLNRNENAFVKILKSRKYIDKTGLLSILNKNLGTADNCICVSRPRRFGKSFNAAMINAYYSKCVNAVKLFAGLKIAESTDYLNELNRHNVICFDINQEISFNGGTENFLENIQKRIIAELNEQYGITVSQNNLPAALIEINLRFAERFIVVIDEWDAIFRDHPDEQKLQEDYVNMLSDLFKGLNSESFIELAYLTGIFPIKMYDRRSSLINFRDYSILTPAETASFFGFTGDEVESICGTFNLDLRLTKLWYDGYILNGLHIYNPYSIMELVSTGIYQSYWNKTASIKAVSSCIELNPGGLLDALITLLEDNRVRTINLDAFNANIYNFESRDAVLTYLIHLGYLGYSDGQLFVPNEELRLELMRAVESSKFDEYLKLIKDSRELLRHTRALDGDYVASVIERFHVRHVSYTSPREYNSKDDLRNLVDVVAGAYLACIEDYLRPAREFPTGRCFADLVYLPYRHASYDLPALIIELKINDEAPGIIGKIKDGDYPDAVNGFTGEIILVTIFYDKLTKFHKCVIESLDKL